jgi:sugar-specific transcriptional regulator TrmB
MSFISDITIKIMNSNKYKKALIGFGLKENEADVYISALKLGPTPILPIAKETGIRRTTIYEIIESLISKGLVTTELKGFKKLYCAAHPQNLVSIFENKKENLEIIIPELTTIYKAQGSENSIKTYESLVSIKSLYLDILNSYKSGDFCYVIGDTDKFIKDDPKFFMKYIEDRAKMDLDIKIIVADSAASRERKKYERNFNCHIKILPKETTLSANFTVTKDIFLTQAVENQQLAITTNNKEIINLQKNLFEMIWNSLKEE